MLLVGLQVTDETSYARYRAGMLPILLSCGGTFGHDVPIARPTQRRERQR
ncbi:hypothetical protein [Sorangium sp. So ce406]